MIIEDEKLRKSKLDEKLIHIKECLWRRRHKEKSCKNKRRNRKSWFLVGCKKSESNPATTKKIGGQTYCNYISWDSA